jgi:hypothetical protein
MHCLPHDALVDWTAWGNLFICGTATDTQRITSDYSPMVNRARADGRIYRQQLPVGVEMSQR